MNREALERELRARLEPLEEDGGREQRIVLATADEAVSALLPWIVEKIEEADTEARLDEGHLP